MRVMFSVIFGINVIMLCDITNMTICQSDICKLMSVFSLSNILIPLTYSSGKMAEHNKLPIHVFTVEMRKLDNQRGDPTEMSSKQAIYSHTNYIGVTTLFWHFLLCLENEKFQLLQLKCLMAPVAHLQPHPPLFSSRYCGSDCGRS